MFSKIRTYFDSVIYYEYTFEYDNRIDYRDSIK